MFTRLLSSFARHFTISIIAIMVVALFVLVTVNVSFLNPIARTLKEFSISDFYFQALQSTASPDTCRAITIVDMTELHDRCLIAKCMQQIESLEPKVLGVDIVFEGLKDIEGDNILEKTALSYDNAIFSYRLLNYDINQHQYTREIHSFFADSIKENEGFTNFQRTLYSGIKRDLSFSCHSKGQQISSFVKLITNSYAEKNYCPKEGELRINFTPTYFTRIRYDSVLMNEDLIKDRIVIFGSTSEESDMHYTPLGKMAGTELLSYAINTLLTERNIHQLPIWLFVPFTFLLVLFTQLWQDVYERKVDSINIQLIRSFMASSVVLVFTTFLWMVFLMWIGFMAFYYFQLNLNMGWALSAMAFVDGARSFYDTCIQSLRK